MAFRWKRTSGRDRVARAVARIGRRGGARAARRYAKAVVDIASGAMKIPSRNRRAMIRAVNFARSAGKYGSSGADPGNIWKDAMDAMVTKIILGNGYFECGGPDGVLDHGNNGVDTCGMEEQFPTGMQWDTSGLRPSMMVWRERMRYSPGTAGHAEDWLVKGRWIRYKEAIGPNMWVDIPADAFNPPAVPRDKAGNYVPPYVRPELAVPERTAPSIPVPYRDIPKREIGSVSTSERTHRGLYNTSWGPVIWTGSGTKPWVRPDWPTRPVIPPRPVPDTGTDTPTAPPKPTDKPIVGTQPGTVAVAAPKGEKQLKSDVTRAAWTALNVYGGWTELRDLVNAVYKALPASRRRWERKARYGRRLTWSEKAAILYEHYDEIDLARAVLEILQANLTDAASAMIAKPGDKLIQEMFPNLGERLAARGFAKQLTDAIMHGVKL